MSDEWFPFNIEKEPKFIWKYLTLNKFIDVLLNNRIWISRLDKFNDPFEAITNQDLYYHEFVKGHVKNPPNNPNLDLEAVNKSHLIKKEELKSSILKRQQKIYAAGFFISDESYESMSMWELYSQHTGVLLKIEYNAFLGLVLHNKSFHKFVSFEKFYGTVVYVPLQLFNLFDAESMTKVLNVGFKKDISYIHEREFRLVFSIGEKENTEIVDGFYHSFEIGSSVRAVIANPFMEDYHFENLKKIINKINDKVELGYSSLKRFV